MTRRLSVILLLVAVVTVEAQAAQETPDELFLRAKTLIEQNAGDGNRGLYAEGVKLMRQAIAAGCSDQASAYKLLARAATSLTADLPYDSVERPAAQAEARQLYEKAIALDPADLNTRWEYSGVLEDTSERRQVLEQILQLDPAYGPALRSYGELLYRSGDVEAGVAKWREGVEVTKNPVQLEYYANDLIAVLEALGRTEEAQAVKQLASTRLNEPDTLRLLTGDNQEGRVGTAVNRLAVEVWTFGGEYAPGEVVTFAITTGVGALSSAQATTGEDGIAATVLTLGDTPGPVTVEARWRDQTVVFHITAIQ